MQTLILVIHVMIALALIGVVLLQRSEGGGLGIGGGGGGAGGGLGLISGRATANLLTRATAILAAAFMATSILLAVIGGGAERGSVLDRAPDLQPLTLPNVPRTPGPAIPSPLLPAPAVPGATVRAPIMPGPTFGGAATPGPQNPPPADAGGPIVPFIPAP